MAANKVNLKIDQGATFDELITWRTGSPPTPVDLTGCTARSQVRSDIDSPSILLEMTTENGKLVLGGQAGTINLKLSATETAAVAWRTGVYDLEIVFPDARVRRLLYGSVNISREITR